jgi:excisionase family DNA binding protein
MPREKDILTIPQAARYCSVDRVTMWRWVKSGNLKASVTPGRHHRILRRDLEEFLRKKGMDPLAKKHFPRRRILIVDDDENVVKSLSKYLALHEYETETASDGFEAGVKITRFKPNLIILDLVMPNIDGFDVCRMIRSDDDMTGIKILALTGYDTDGHRVEIMNAGADVFLVKPVDEAVLMRYIHELVGEPVEKPAFR